MKILVIDPGGRGHALCWKIRSDHPEATIYCAPGNAGISSIAECVSVPADNIAGLADFAAAQRIDLTIVGQEKPLAAGIVDAFREAGLPIFGPTQQASKLEWSKVYCKRLLAKYNIPTAYFGVFDEPGMAKAYVSGCALPAVIKADGLWNGKGVAVVTGVEEAEQFIDRLFTREQKILIEDCLKGRELSLMALCDGVTYRCLPPARDFKRRFEGDKGPMTGGMAAYSSVPDYTPELHHQVVEQILNPLMKALRQEGIDYRGMLYLGLMLTADGPFVVELNCRPGDPETQVVLPRLKTDIVELAHACIDGTLHKPVIEWSSDDCACVGLVHEQYPQERSVGEPIHGLNDISPDEALVFHAGTAFDENGRLVTNGGRIVSVTAFGKNPVLAVSASYAAASRISFRGMAMRHDIADQILALS